MSDFNNIEKLFQEKLENFEMPVRAELWNKVSASAGIAKTTFWSATKIAAASVVGVIAVSAVVWFVMNDNAAPNSPQFVEQHQVFNESNATTNDVVVDEQALSEANEKQIEAPSRANVDNTDRNTPLVLNRTPIFSPTFEDEAPIMYVEEPINAENPTRNQEVDFPIVEQISSEFEPAPVEVLNLELLIAPEKTEEQSLEKIHFPHQFVQVFNPNLPGETGQFTVYSENLGSFKIEIKTRAGKLVFTSTDPNFVWRGEQMDGAQAPEGTYMYTIFSTTMDGEPIKPQAGSVFLMRK